MRILQVRRRWPTRSALAVLWWTCGWVLFRSLLVLVYRLRCAGGENVPARGAIVYVANHQSYLDPPAVGSLVYDRPFASMAKSGLFAFGPFAWLIRSVGAMPLRQGESDVAAMRAAIRELQGGGTVLVFPEGTRSRDGSMGPFKPGVLALLRRAPAAVVPVAVEGTHDAWPIGRRFPRLLGRIAVRAGEPLDGAALLALPQDGALEVLRRRVETLRLEIRRDLRDRSRGRYPAPGPGDRPYWEREGR